jgi:hypothetical protein
MKTIMRLLVFKTLSVCALLMAVAITAAAQDARITTTQLDLLATKAIEKVDVSIDESLMQMAAKFLSNRDADEASVKELVNGLKGIYVKSFEFDTEGQYTAADVESIRSQLRNPSWKRVLDVQSRREGTVEVYLMLTGSEVKGLTLLATDPKEITVVNIVGPVDLERLKQLEGSFGVPDLRIEGAKRKRKNE